MLFFLEPGFFPSIFLFSLPKRFLDSHRVQVVDAFNSNYLNITCAIQGFNHELLREKVFAV
jgi:hypothetical protein